MDTNYLSYDTNRKLVSYLICLDLVTRVVETLKEAAQIDQAAEVSTVYQAVTTAAQNNTL